MPAEYDEAAANYAEKIADNATNAYYERPATLSLLTEVGGKRVLDAGCGPGLYAEWLAAHGAHVTCLDISANMIALVKQRLGSRVEARQADLSQPLDFLADESQEIIVAPLVIHYVQVWEPLFAEFHRVLTPGGWLVFSTHHPGMDFALSPSGDYFATELIEEIWDIGGKPTKISFYRRPLSAILSPLLTAGFQIDRILEPQPLPECKDKFPEIYENLATKPRFLFVRARKSPNG